MADSRVNGTGPIRAETQIRIDVAVAWLDHRPDSVARAPVTGRSGTLSVIAWGIDLTVPASTLSETETPPTTVVGAAPEYPGKGPLS
ncbi:hypothetical protein [Amycolatopsis thailandensis]|uniref:hypothetical protein n=1 Tax=Amycolatopsis thailandensis TaxID=589330 RepID=UPI003645C712